MPTLRADVPEMARAVGERLRRLRKSRRLTRPAVAAVLKVTPQAVFKYEKGLSQLPVDLTVKLAKLYGVTCDHILLGEEDRHAA